MLCFFSNLLRLSPLILIVFTTTAFTLLIGHSEGTLLWRPVEQSETIALDGNWMVDSINRQKQQKVVYGQFGSRRFGSGHFPFRQLLQAPPPSYRPASSVSRFSPLGGTSRFMPVETSSSWADKRASLLARLANQSARGFGRK
ncbi:hypothetical protein GPALN_005448 [Globodera pallida]|nr:hypothetical protein GPALN_005448 [Globodera pallida]